MTKKSILAPVFSFFCLLSFSCFVLAQGTTSRVTGTVIDNNGAVVAGATVTLINEGTGISLTTETSESGVYTFDLLQVGTYRVAVEKTGFKKFISKGNTINVNQPATVNIALEIGDVSVTVEVVGTAERVQTSTSGNVGSTVEQKTLESVPIVASRGRNPLSLLNFQPGIVEGAATGGGVHVHGSRDRAFNFTLDGIDINESSAGGSNFTPLRPNPDSIEEFQIVTSGFTAELGRSSGAQVTLVTKSGTNQLKGNLFEFYQTPGAIANTYSNNLLGLPRPKFIQHMFGGSLGGPIPLPNFGEGGPITIKNKAFFFTNLQILRQRQAQLAQRTVYTQEARQGLFRYIRGGRNANAAGTDPSINSSGAAVKSACSATVTTNCLTSYNIAANPSGVGIDQTILGIINTTPLPNDFSIGDGLNTAGYNFLAPTTEEQYDLVMKFDFKLDPKNQFYVRWAQGEQNTISDSGNAGLAPFPGLPGTVDTYRTPKNLAINYRWSPTGNITNEFIFGYSKFTFFFGTPDYDVPFTFNTITTPGTGVQGNGRGVTTYQYIDNLTFIKGSHILKGGINFRLNKQIDDRSDVGGSSVEGVINFSTAINSNFNAFTLPATGATGLNTNDLPTLQAQINNLLGRVGTYRQAFVSNSSGSAFEVAGTRYGFQANYAEYDFYFQDTWKYRPNITVDLGLRWEPKFSPTSEGLPVLRPDQATTLGSAPSTTVKWVEGKLFEDQWNTLSPSVGFAWDPFKDGKTSVRANYRLSYDRIGTHMFGQNIFQNTPGNNISFPTSDAFGAGGGLYRNLPTLTPTSTPLILRQLPIASGSSFTVIAPDLEFSSVHQWYAGFQREIGWGSVLEVNYIGKRGLDLYGGYNANQVNINARDSRFNESFLDAFKTVKAGGDSPLINQLLLNDSRRTAAQTGSQFARVQFATDLANNSVATMANSIATRTQSGATLLSLGGFNQFLFQKYPQFATLTVVDSNDTSTYHGLEIIMKRRFSAGLAFQLGYTFSKSMDSRSFDPVFTTIGTGASQTAANTPFANERRSLNWAWSDFDRRHALQSTFVFELPFGKGRQFGSSIPLPLDWVIGGWQLAGNFNLAAGRPFTVFGLGNTLSQSVSTPANCNGCSRDMGQVVERLGTNYFFTVEQEALFSNALPGEFSNTGRNYFIGPHQFQLDMALSKKFRITERMSFDLRAEASNLPNAVTYAAPNVVVGSTAAPFGRIRTGVSNSARRIQFVGKFNF